MNMQVLLRQAKKMQKEINDLEKKVNEQIFEGSAGGGIVKVIIKGNLEVKNITIAEDLIKEDKAQVEELVMLAVNDAIATATKEKEKQMNAVTGGVKMPGVF